MEATAKQYKGYGLSPLPVNDKKEPTVGQWKGVELEDNRFVGVSGVAVKTGSVSGHLEALDFDNHFGDAKDIIFRFFLDDDMQALKNKHSFVVETTRSGGYHILFRSPGAGNNQKLASRPTLEGGRWKPEALIETRGENGYVVVAPTEGYSVIRGSFAAIPELSAEEREVLINRAKSFNEFKEIIERRDEKEGRPGDHYNNDPESTEEAKGILEKNGWQQVSTYGWRRPGKEEGISATFGYVDTNVLFNFSANSYPFDPDKPYTPFQIKGLLEYDGDFEKLARDLGERYKTELNQNQTAPEPAAKRSESELAAFLEKAKIDLSKTVEKPPTILSIKNDMMEDQRLFTLGNFSAITGKSKSKKTFLMVMFASTLQTGGMNFNKFVGELPQGSQVGLYFDTEQSEYDAWNTAKRVERLTGTRQNFYPFCLREYSAMERCELIEYAITNIPDVGWVVIDGIADLATAINDEDEATRVSQLLLRWTKEYNCHVSTIIHQNKNDNYATGHLGSFVMKKAEAVVSVKKDESDPRISNVSCDLIRGASEFDPFDFSVNAEGLPEIVK